MLDENLLIKLKEYNHARKYDPNFKKDKKLESLLSSRYQKVSRIKQHFVWLLQKKKYFYFVTFTFDDEHIKLCDRSRKDLIKKSLYSFDNEIYYILNIDYGKQTERLHYHAIIGTNRCSDFNQHLLDNYPCFIKVENIRLDKNSIIKLPKYLNKLSNHAVKRSTRNSRILYNFKGYGDMTVPEVRYTYIFDKECLGLT